MKTIVSAAFVSKCLTYFANKGRKAYTCRVSRLVSSLIVFTSVAIGSALAEKSVTYNFMSSSPLPGWTYDAQNSIVNEKYATFSAFKSTKTLLSPDFAPTCIITRVSYTYRCTSASATRWLFLKAKDADTAFSAWKQSIDTETSLNVKLTAAASENITGETSYSPTSAITQIRFDFQGSGSTGAYGIKNVTIYYEEINSEDPVEPGNIAWTTIPDKTTKILTPVSFDVSATIDDVAVAAGAISFAGLTKNDLPFTSVNTPSFTAGSFSWTPDTTETGAYVALFTAQNGDGTTSTNEVNITVTAPTVVWATSPAVELMATVESTISVSATLDGEPVSNFSFVGFFSGSNMLDPYPAQNPTLSGGVLTWTPQVSDIGSYVARFSAVNADGSTSKHDVNISVVARAIYEELLYETFKKCNAGWSTYRKIAEKGPDLYTDNAGWEVSSYVYEGLSAVRLGKTDSGGYMISPVLNVVQHPVNAKVKVSFYAGKYNESAQKLSVSILDADEIEVDGQNQSFSPILCTSDISSTDFSVDSAGSALEAEFDRVPRSFRVKFTSSQKDARIAIDSIRVVQVISADAVELDAPTGLEVEETTPISVSATWTAVDYSSIKYSAKILNSDEEQIALIEDISGTSVTFNDLTPDTTYSIYVLAQGDTYETLDSEWSSPLEVTTDADPNRPTWSITDIASSYYALEPVTFTLTAVNNEVLHAIELISASPAMVSACDFTGGEFTWTPAREDAGKEFTLNFRTLINGSVYDYSVALNITAPRPIVAIMPNIELTSLKTAELTWAATQPAVEMYGVKVWRGSESQTSVGCEEESFYLTSSESNKPEGYSWWCNYLPNSHDNPIALQETGHYLTTRAYPKAVTKLEFYLYDAGVNSGSTSRLDIYASDGDTNWSAEPVYSLVGADEIKTGNYSISFDDDANYRRFKMIYTKGGGNVRVGRLKVYYDGAGTKFLVGSADASVKLTDKMTDFYSIEGLHAATEYFVSFSVYDYTEGGTGERVETVQRFRTADAPIGTLFLIR